METQPSTPGTSYEFYFADLDTLVQVENRSPDVIIRASRNSFTERRKLYFIRELAAEGFIPDDYHLLALAGSPLSHGVHWIVEPAELSPAEGLATLSRPWMVRVFCAAGLLWVGGVAVLLFYSWR